MDDDDFDASEGKKRGRKGMERIKRANEELMGKDLAYIGSLPKGLIVQIEDIRDECEQRYGKPTHPNFYGSLGREAIKLEILKRTGRRVRMKHVRSNGRMTDELVRP